jgi:hypothetical protein
MIFGVETWPLRMPFHVLFSYCFRINDAPIVGLMWDFLEVPFSGM